MNSAGPELPLMEDTMDLYIGGIDTGVIDLLKKAFHPKAMVYGASPGNVTLVAIEQL